MILQGSYDYQLDSSCEYERSRPTQEDHMNPPRLELFQQRLPTLLVAIIRVVDDDLTSLSGKEIPNLILDPILDTLPQRRRLL
jgi:hypothetical protein